MNRFNGSAPVIPHYPLEMTELHTWFERDRSHVELRAKDTEETIVEWWDEDAQEAFEDGFLDMRRLHESAHEYAVSIGAIR